MSSTRNTKRKRQGNEATAGSTPQPSQSRRRSRDQRALASTLESAPSEAPATTDTATIDDGKETQPSKPEEVVHGDASSAGPTNVMEDEYSKESNSQQQVENEGTTGKDEKQKRRTEQSNGKSFNATSSSGETSIKRRRSASGLQSDAVSPHSGNSSQDGASTRRQALHVVNEDIGDRDTITDDRESRIRDLIAHRSMLLTRVRICRESAQRRLGETSSKGQGKELTDDEEIAAFRERTKQANLASKRSRDGDLLAAEKRTSLSLRRGSSVGKRMNAALSSLAPGSNVTHPTIDGSGTPATPALGANSLQAKSAPKTAPSSVPSSVIPKFAPAAASVPSPANSTANQINKFSIASNQSTKPPEQTSSRGRASNSKGARALSTSISAAAGIHAPPSTLARPGDPVAKFPLHMGTSSGNLPPNRLAYQPQKVHFPEAAALREKREKIEARLRVLLERQQQRQDPAAPGNMFATEVEGRWTVPSSGNGTIHNKPSKKKGSRVSDLEILPPTPLPNRRRTHWDSLLQEMSWLAADFIEERKWKVSSARLISSKIPQHALSTRRMTVVSTSPSATLATEAANDTDTLNILSIKGDANERTLSLTFETNHNMEKNKTKKKDMYTKLSRKDENSARCVGRVLSSMISELNFAVRKGGSSEPTNKYHQEALHHFLKARADIFRQHAESLDSLGFREEPKKYELKEPTGNSDMMVEGGDKEHNVGQNVERNFQELSFDGITERIDRLHKISKSRQKSSSKEFSNAIKHRRMELNNEQKDMVDFVEKLWAGKPSSGAAIMGPTISGKTFATATILWKHREKGVQLLICSPLSLIRWRHELNQFTDLRVIIFGHSGGISNPQLDNNVEILKTSDVVICEYASLSRLKDTLADKKISLHSVVVDCRHTLALRVSMGVAIHELPDDGSGFPRELLSHEWWENLVDIVKGKSTHILFVEYFDSDPFTLSKSGLGPKEQLYILAKRAACIIGPDVFYSESLSIQRQILAWARQRGKQNITDKISRVKKVLIEATSPLCFHIDKSIVTSSDFIWDLRSCVMPQFQRKEYETCCLEVRGALSSHLSEGIFQSVAAPCPIRAASSSLFRLRQYCFHPSGMDILTKTVLKNAVRREFERGVILPFREGTRKVGFSSSQPDTHAAKTLLEGSSKLRELIAILVKEAGHDVSCEEILRSILESTNSEEDEYDGKRPRKVAILAVLPEIQVLVSVLLNALGIKNELLGTNMSPIDAQSSGLASTWGRHEAISWVACQETLSRFCDDEDYDGERGNNLRDTNIVIASPSRFLRGDNGLGIEGADMIITLDSDWSGRDGLILDSLIKRWLARNVLIDKEVHLIRLICSDTVEGKLFGDNENAYEKSFWPLDHNGFLALPSSKEEASKLFQKSMDKPEAAFFSFPAVRVLRERGQLLSDVLVTSVPLPPLFGSGGAVKFLPRQASNGASDDHERIAELQFIHYFLRCEQLSTAYCCTPTYGLTQSNVAANANGPKSSLLRSCGASFPSGLISRQDLVTSSICVFFERMTNSQSLLQIPGGDGPSILLSQLTDSSLVGLETSDGTSNLTIEQSPLSLLFYEPRQEFSSTDAHGLKYDAAGNSHKRRFNAYAKLFSSCWDEVTVRDGNQGTEPLVFFPPLFPLLKESSKKARIDCQTPSSSIETHGTTRDNSNSQAGPFASQSAKRKDRELLEMPESAQQNSKRLKAHPNFAAAENETDSTMVIVGQPSPNNDESMAAPRTEEPTKKPLQYKEEPITEGPKNPVIIAKSQESQYSNRTQDGDDFGVLGCGAIPRPVDAASFSARDEVRTSSSSPAIDMFDFVSCLTPSDCEEACATGYGMRSMLLFVKNRPKEPQSLYGRHSQGLSRSYDFTGSTHVPTAPASINGDELSKKAKKRTSLPMHTTTTAFSRVPTAQGGSHGCIVPPTTLANTKKVDYRHQLLSSYHGRQRTTGLTMFDSVSYRAASIRVERRVLERFERLMWKSTLTYDAGPGLPTQLEDESFTGIPENRAWMSVAEKLPPGSSTGDAAIMQSHSQKTSLRRSLVSPCRVDFGPFNIGFLASPSGMTVISTPRSRVGVSLPMGVKIQSAREQKPCSWDSSSDKLLQDAAKRFGMNWLLVANTLSGFEGAIVNETVAGVNSVVSSTPRSARQCRDRWQVLARMQSSVASEVRRSERLFRDNGKLSSDEIADIEASKTEKCGLIWIDGVSILFNRSFLRKFSPEEGFASDNESGQESKTNNLVVEVEPITAIESNQVTEDPDAGKDIAMADAPTSVPVQEREIPKKRSFAALSIAKSRKQTIPVTIPGVVSGQPPSHPVPSHPSHIQAVQTSVTAQWASGRTEMWPLQILDLADKQKSAARTATSIQHTESVPPSKTTSPSARRIHHHGPGNSTTALRSPPSHAPPAHPHGVYPPVPTSVARSVPPPRGAAANNPASPPQHLHHPPYGNPPVAVATAQAYLPPQRAPVARPANSSSTNNSGDVA